jgi:hypothetical protein
MNPPVEIENPNVAHFQEKLPAAKPLPVRQTGLVDCSGAVEMVNRGARSRVTNNRRQKTIVKKNGSK